MTVIFNIRRVPTAIGYFAHDSWEFFQENRSSFDTEPIQTSKVNFWHVLTTFDVQLFLEVKVIMLMISLFGN